MAILTIARLTIQEAINRRLMLAALILSAVMLALFAVGFAFIFQRGVEQGRQFSNAAAMFGAVQTVLGFYAVYMLTTLLAIFLAVGAIASEIDSGALQAVLARPLARRDYLLGRWLAYTGMITVYLIGMTGGILAIVRLIANYTPPDPIRAIGLMALSVTLIVTISLLGSARLSTLPNGIVLFSLFGLSWLGGIVEFVGLALNNDSMVNLGVGVSLLIPNDGLWRGASYYLQPAIILSATQTVGGILPFAANTPPAAPFLLWSVGYIAVSLIAAIVVFQRRDI